MGFVFLMRQLQLPVVHTISSWQAQRAYSLVSRYDTCRAPGYELCVRLHALLNSEDRPPDSVLAKPSHVFTSALRNIAQSIRTSFIMRHAKQSSCWTEAPHDAAPIPPHHASSHNDLQKLSQHPPCFRTEVSRFQDTRSDGGMPARLRSSDVHDTSAGLLQSILCNLSVNSDFEVAVP